MSPEEVTREVTGEVTPGRARAFGLAVALSFSLVLCVAGLFYASGGARPVPARPAPPAPHSSDAESQTAGWTGQLELADGTRLIARVVSLHSERERQEFDAQALAARLALARGEPWRLDLRRLSAPPNAASGAAPGAVVDLRALCVEDERGLALATIAPHRETGETREGVKKVLDPLRTLLAPPAERLAPGQAIEIVLWGREPAGGARLCGILDVALALEPATIRCADVPGTLASLDRATAPGVPGAPVAAGAPGGAGEPAKESR